MPLSKCSCKTKTWYRYPNELQVKCVKTVTLSYPYLNNDIEQAPSSQVVAIGQFDGLHLGHASVIEQAVALAREGGCSSAVLTFHPHPKDVMRKGDYEGYLTPMRDKQELLAGMGVDTMYVVEFNEAFSRVSPHDFFTNMLVPLNIKTAVVGFDFRFGYKGEGHAQMLQEFGEGLIQVVTVSPFLLDEEKVSSSAIRRALHSGEVEQVSHWLGRNYSLRGTVIDGEKRGRTIGFPTANLELEDRYVVPAKGVYAIKAHYKDQLIPGVMNLGVKPTFHQDGVKPTFEVHLLDFNANLYGEQLQVELVAYIRSEQKFPSIDALVAQIQNDTEVARKILG